MIFIVDNDWWKQNLKYIFLNSTFNAILINVDFQFPGIPMRTLTASCDTSILNNFLNILIFWYCPITDEINIGQFEHNFDMLDPLTNEIGIVLFSKTLCTRCVWIAFTISHDRTLIHILYEYYYTKVINHGETHWFLTVCWLNSWHSVMIPCSFMKITFKLNFNRFVEILNNFINRQYLMKV